jgi:hypothetical protein
MTMTMTNARLEQQSESHQCPHMALLCCGIVFDATSPSGSIPSSTAATTTCLLPWILSKRPSDAGMIVHLPRSRLDGKARHFLWR